MKFLLAFVLGLVAAAASVFALFNLSGADVTTARWVLTLFFLWMLYGMLRSVLHIRALRRMPVDPEAPEGEVFISRPAPAGVFLAKYLFHPLGLRFRTVGTVLFLAGLLYYTLRTDRLFLFYIFLALALISKVYLYVNYLRLYRLHGRAGKLNVFTRVDGSGISLVGKKGEQAATEPLPNDDEAIYLTHTPWSNVTEVWQFPGMVKIVARGEGMSEYFLFATAAQRAKCISAVAQNFRRGKKKASPQARTTATAFRLFEALERTALLLTPQAGGTAPLADGSCKLGGAPDAGNAFSWPQNEGRGMVHLLQLNLGELSECFLDGTYPRDGLLNVFVDPRAERREGEGNAGAVQVVCTQQREGVPFRPTPQPAYEAPELLPEVALTAKSINVVPQYDEYVRRTGQPDTNRGTYRYALEESGEYGPEEMPCPKENAVTLGGHFAGRETELPVGDADCHILLQTLLPKALGMPENGGGNLLAITLPKGDLAKADFSHIQWKIESCPK